MIQRIQSIYLLFAIVCMSISLFTSYCSYLIDDKEIVLNAFGLLDNDLDVTIRFPYYIPIFASVGLSILALANFKNRKKQLIFGKINYLVILISLVFIMLDITYTGTIQRDGQSDFFPESYFWDAVWWIGLPIGQIVGGD